MAPQAKTPAAAKQQPIGQAVTNGESAVNRKKQKRRQKQAAKLAAEQTTGTSKPVAEKNQNGHPPSRLDYEQGADLGDEDDPSESRGEDFNSEIEGPNQSESSKSKKKKKKKARSQNDESSFDRPHGVSKDRIWNTSTAEERERIKEFWLSLEESERRSLVKVEKEAVLKKMKEQQRNSCSCTICGRKRTAIEEELEVLYDAYYEELEQYANHQQIDGTIMAPPPGAYPPMPRPRPLHHHHHHTHHHHHIPAPPPKGRIMEEFDDEDEPDDEGYSDEEDSEDGDYYEEDPRGPATEFFNFGNSLTVQGGILTVADDLLKNDGKKFIEMMEQLAERRMAREKMHAGRYEQPPMRHAAHDHGPPLDDDEDYDDEDDGDYDDSQDEYEDEEEMEAMSEEQRMEEGRRMFQIFAARMFEQRVLTAYREKVAKERQERLIEELNNEDAQKAQKEAKKAKEAQKKKDKKKQQKAAKEEERLRKEAEKEAQLAAAKAAEEKKAEEQRVKREEQRKKREAEKRALEEERQRKEAEKQQRLREQQAEVERKQREQKDREKKRKEDAKKKEREEREARAKKEREEKEARAKAEADFSSKSKKDEYASKHAVQPAVPALSRKASTQIVPSIAPGLHTSLPVSHVSPHVPVATPAIPIPKAPSPVKPRQTSQHDSHQSSPKSVQNTSDSSSTSAMSGTTTQQAQMPPGLQASFKNYLPPGPTSSSLPPPPGIPPSFPVTSPSLSSASFASYNSAPGMPPRMPGPDMYGYQPMHPPGFRPFVPQGNFPLPPGINIPRQMNPQGRGSPIEPPPPPPIGHYPATHSRQASGSYNRGSLDHGAIAPPNPIERPSSLPQQENEIDDLSKRLGSSALGDSMEDGPDLKPQEPRGAAPPGRPNRLGFGASPFPEIHPRINNFAPNTWGAPQVPMAMPNQPAWSAGGGPWPSSNSNFGPIGGARINPAHLRSMACRACRQLSAANIPKSHGIVGDFHSLESIMRQMEQLKGPGEGAIIENELVKVLEAEGSAQNGGGIFEIQVIDRVPYARFEPSNFGARTAGAPGEIGSPVPGNSMPFGRGYSNLNL